MKHIKTFESFANEYDMTNEKIGVGHKIGKTLGVPASRRAYINDQLENLPKDKNEKEQVVDKLFNKYFGSYIEDKGAIKQRLGQVKLEDKIQILEDLAKDSKGITPVGALNFEKGRLVYVPFEESKLVAPGGHVFGSGE